MGRNSGERPVGIAFIGLAFNGSEHPFLVVRVAINVPTLDDIGLQPGGLLR